MKPAGRPLRFLAILLGGWISARCMAFVLSAWVGGDAVQPVAAFTPDDSAKSVAPTEAPVGLPAFAAATIVQAERFAPVVPLFKGAKALSSPIVTQQEGGGDVSLVNVSEDRAPPNGPSPRVAKQSSMPPAQPLAAEHHSRQRPWSAQAWLLWRPDTARDGAALAPLLGGSQAGVRIDYRLSESRAGTFGLYGRASRALSGPSSQEVAAGLTWRPGTLPVSLMVERREKLSAGARSDFAAMVAGGVNAISVAPRIEAEGYVQAGVVGLAERDVFADGKASLSYRAIPSSAGPRVLVGGALSASVQPQARRIDIGPELRLHVPMAGGGLRLSAEWRARIAGNARPSGGPAITLVTDF